MNDFCPGVIARQALYCDRCAGFVLSSPCLGFDTLTSCTCTIRRGHDRFGFTTFRAFVCIRLSHVRFCSIFVHIGMSFQNTFSNFQSSLAREFAWMHLCKSFQRNRTLKYSSCEIIVLGIVQIQTNGSHLRLIGWIDGSKFGPKFRLDKTR